MLKLAAPRQALLIVDFQNDFLPHGALGVKTADALVPLMQNLLELCVHHRVAVFMSRDWHPHNHLSFRAQGGQWPPHCVADTLGAAFPSNLYLPAEVQIISKAQRWDQEAYSAFFETSLHERLGQQHIQRVWLAGLATDYCVFETGKDALQLGYEVVILTDAIAAVNLKPEDGERALLKLQQAGAQLSTSQALREAISANPA